MKLSNLVLFAKEAKNLGLLTDDLELEVARAKPSSSSFLYLKNIDVDRALELLKDRTILVLLYKYNIRWSRFPDVFYVVE